MKWKHIWAAALALFFLFILTACGNERIFSASPAETGESYSSNDFSSGNPATSEKFLKLQAEVINSDASIDISSVMTG